MTTSDSLNDCPFCGKVAVTVNQAHYGEVVGCGDLHCAGSHLRVNKEIWNIRHPSAPDTGRLIENLQAKKKPAHCGISINESYYNYGLQDAIAIVHDFDASLSLKGPKTVNQDKPAIDERDFEKGAAASSVSTVSESAVASARGNEADQAAPVGESAIRKDAVIASDDARCDEVTLPHTASDAPVDVPALLAQARNTVAPLVAKEREGERIDAATMGFRMGDAPVKQPVDHPPDFIDALRYDQAVRDSQAKQSVDAPEHKFATIPVGARTVGLAIYQARGHTPGQITEYVEHPEAYPSMLRQIDREGQAAIDAMAGACSEITDVEEGIVTQLIRDALWSEFSDTAAGLEMAISIRDAIRAYLRPSSPVASGDLHELLNKLETGRFYKDYDRDWQLVEALKQHLSTQPPTTGGNLEAPK